MPAQLGSKCSLNKTHTVEVLHQCLKKEQLPLYNTIQVERNKIEVPLFLFFNSYSSLKIQVGGTTFK